VISIFLAPSPLQGEGWGDAKGLRSNSNNFSNSLLNQEINRSLFNIY
jgi:hypothetical protein